MTVRIKTRLQERFVQQTALLLAMRVLGTGLGFLFWVLAARLVAQDQVGIASGAISAVALLAGLAQLGLGYVLLRSLNHAANPVGLLNMIISIVGGVALLEAVVFLLGLSVWSPELLTLRSTLMHSGLFLLLAGGTALSQLLHWVFLARQQLTLSLIKQLSQSLLALGFLWLFHPLGGYISVLAAYVSAVLSALLLAWFGCLPRTLPHYRLSWPQAAGLPGALIKDALPNHLSDQLQRAPDTLLPLVALHTLGPSGGATFFIVWSLGSGISSWAGSVAESLLAEGMRQPERIAQQMRRATQIGLALTLGIGLCIAGASPLILKLYGVQYAGAGRWLLLAVTASGLPWVLLSLQVSRLRILRRHRAVMGLMLSSNGLGIVVAGALMAYGMVWAGLGWLAVQTSICALTYLWPQPAPAMAVEHSIG